jgi:hypothetical protein
MVTADILLPRGELAHDPHSAFQPILIPNVAAGAKPELDRLANDRSVRDLPPRGLTPNRGGLLPGQLELPAFHAIMMA